MQLPFALAPLRALPRLGWVLLLTLACLLPAQGALAMGPQDFPATPPVPRVIDEADLVHLIDGMAKSSPGLFRQLAAVSPTTGNGD